MKLSGKQIKALRLALVEAFPTPEDLRRMLREELDRNLDAIALGANQDEIVSRVIAKAEAFGWLPALIDGACKANPDNQQLAQVAASLLTTRAAPSVGSLEQIVRARSPLLHIEVLLDFLERSKRRVCLIETVDGVPTATGVLVGPDVVMTNYHVIEGFEYAQHPPFRLRFDHIAGADGRLVTQGRTCSLAENWLLGFAPSSPSDFDDGREPAPTQLDFALLRIKELIGREHVDGAPRGWVPIPPAPPTLQCDDIVCVIQHPRGQPLQITIDAVIAVNSNATRVRYRPNTLPGSSGSPCFDLNRQMVALHQGGLPGTYNQGIPVAALSRHFITHGLDKYLGEPTR